LIAATLLEQKQMAEFYGADPHKISIVPPGVDLNRFRPMSRLEARQHLGLPPDRQTILFVGRIQPLKGIDTLIKALSLIKKREPDLVKNVCVCVIGGDPRQDSDYEKSELARLRSLQTELELGDLVTFLGAKDQDSLIYYYSAAALAVMPSHYESFGMVALEAMACGTPVVASDVGGLSFNIEDGYNGYLVPGQDPQAMADKIILLLKYRVLRDQLAEQALTWVTRYSWVNIAEELLEVFEQTLRQYQHGSDGRFATG
jgi:D-inositol-3-phosphate glycosyltransferase